MVNYFAKMRNNHGAWLQGLIRDQAQETGVSTEELEEFVRLSTQQARALIALDNPAPARGYALMLADPLGDRGDVIARVHLLDGTADAGARALFSQMSVHARRLAQKRSRVKIAVDHSALSDFTREQVEELGAPYGVVLTDGGTTTPEEAETAQEAQDEPDGVFGEETSRAVENFTAPQITAEEAAGGDLADPRVRQFFEERGVQVDEEDEEPDELASDGDVKESAPKSDDQEDEEHPYECFDCGRRFATPQALGSHSRTHSE